jgi:hypothetical protein
MVGIRPKKTFHAWNGHSLLCMDLTELAASDAKRVNDPLAVELVIWWVSGIICQRVQPTINLARMDTVQSKMTFSVVDKRPLLCVILGNPFATKRKRLNDSLAVKLPIWWVSKMTC